MVSCADGRHMLGHAEGANNIWLEAPNKGIDLQNIRVHLWTEAAEFGLWTSVSILEV